jgi:hypothetical protein
MLPQQNSFLQEKVGVFLARFRGKIKDQQLTVDQHDSSTVASTA